MGVRLDLRGGGWVIAASALVSLAFVLHVVLVRSDVAGERVGDGEHVESYGFDLSDLRIPRETLVASPIPRDGLTTLDRPPVIDIATAKRLNAQVRGKYLVSTDRVIGVVVGGEARAYPLRVLNWHEIVNDEIGGRPVLVAYHPLSGSAVVFDRRINGEILDFGLSGLFSNSHHLLYDRNAPRGRESLWCPLLAEAVAGPRSGRRLEVLASFLGPWSEWCARHPDSKVIDPDRRLLSKYQQSPYTGTRAPHLLRYPVAPLPLEGPGKPSLKSRILAIQAGEEEKTFLISTPPAGHSPGTPYGVSIGPLRVELVWRRTPEFALPWLELRGVEGGASESPAQSGLEPVTFHAYWFAWYAFHPQAKPIP